MSEETNVIGHISIKITETDVEYDTEFSVPEVVFWLETLKAMVLKKVVDDNGN